MTHVSKIFSVEQLWREIDNGNVRVQTHPTLPFYIFNYTEKTAFDKRWNDVTLNCRGLILDASNNIVARPWKKFFNYGEGRLAIDDTMPVEVTDKMDGSLGILYPCYTPEIGWYDNIATRGSFDSDQARHASKIWQDRYAFNTGRSFSSNVMPEYTFLFEIIYPANRIVLNYGDLDDLVLLGAVNIEHGYYVGPREAQALLNWPGPVTQVFEYKTMAEAFAAPMRPNAEGLVVRSGTEIVKVKQSDYVELHRIVTNLNPRTIWARLAAGETVEQMAEYIPDEWFYYTGEVVTRLQSEYKAVEDRVMSQWFSLETNSPGNFVTRKDYALEINKRPDRAYLFRILDNKSIADMIWAEIKPAVTKE